MHLLDDTTHFGRSLHWSDVKAAALRITFCFITSSALFMSGCIKDPVIPTLVTDPVKDITVSSVTATGKITDDGGADIISKGVCWGTEKNPTTEGLHSEAVPSTGEFTITINGLKPNTLYYVRAYAENSAGTAYGNQVVFTTNAALPELTTVIVSGITTNTAVSGGRIIYDGGAEIIAKGICWSTAPDPDIIDPFTSNGADTAGFTGQMTGLSPGTRYYVRAYAQNKAGTVYGNQVIFNTKISDTEGNLYGTVTIGTQTWMAENLRTTKLNNNTVIPYVTENTQWSKLTGPAYCWFLNDVNYKPIYGALYNWYAAGTGKLCPTGWHVATDEDYKTLELFLGIPISQVDFTEWRGTDQGTQMKATNSWDNGGNGTNSSGFSALAGGYRYGATGAFTAEGILTYWWSSECTIDYGWYRRLDDTASGVYRGLTSKRGGKYVRCVKN